MTDNNGGGGGLNLQIHPTVFWTAAGLIAFFVAFSLFNLAQMKEVFGNTHAK